jgi:hypothetical protein
MGTPQAVKPLCALEKEVWWESRCWNNEDQPRTYAGADWARSGLWSVGRPFYWLLVRVIGRSLFAQRHSLVLGCSYDLTS